MLSAAELAPPGLALALALVLARPLGALALLLPLALLWAARRARPAARVTGTAALWPEGPPPGGRERRRRPPLATWLAALALALGALALAGPRPSSAARLWTVVVDTRPSLGLALAAGGAGEPGATRAAWGMARARELVGERARRADRVRWIARGAPELVLSPAQLPPPGWWPAQEPLGEPAPFELHDAPGVLVVTDLAPVPALARAGWVASGASPLPGPIAADGADLLVWDGAELRREPGAAAGRTLVVERGAGAAALPAVLERLLEAWSDARGIARAPQRTPASALVLELAGDAGRAAAVVCGRDGWSARGMASALPEPAQDEPRERWLEASADDGARWCAVDARAGRVRSSLVELAEPAGDPAAFAVSWAELLDRACLPPAGVVPLAERQRQGARAERAPLEPPPSAGERGGDLDAWLAAGCALVFLAALAAARRAQSGS